MILSCGKQLSVLSQLGRAVLFCLLVAFAGAAERRPLIAVGGILHESNTFNPARTEFRDFTQRGEVAELAKNQDEIAGYIEGARKFDFDVYLTLVAKAVPRGPVTEDALDRLTALLIERLEK